MTSAPRFSLDRSKLSPHLSALTGRQISRGKFDRFQHTTGGSTCAALMDQHFVAEATRDRRIWPHIRFLFIGSCFCFTLPPTRLTAAALALRYPSPPCGW